MIFAKNHDKCDVFKSIRAYGAVADRAYSAVADRAYSAVAFRACSAMIFTLAHQSIYHLPLPKQLRPNLESAPFLV